MSLLANILTFVGFIAITFGAADIISKWLKAAEERKRLAEVHHREVTASLRRIEEALRQQKP